MKKISLGIIAVMSLFLFSGCDLFNKAKDAMDNAARDTESAFINGLDEFNSEIDKLKMDTSSTANDFANYGATNGYEITSGTYSMNVYKFDKDTDEYKKFERDQMIYTDEANGNAATVKNGYAIVIDNNFPQRDKILALFDRLR